MDRKSKSSLLLDQITPHVNTDGHEQINASIDSSTDPTSGIMRDEIPGSTRPLAVRMRPHTLDEVIGQDDVLTPSSPLRAIARPAGTMNGSSPSAVILTGPPGVGKTTIAKILAAQSGRELVELSATSSSVKDVKNAMMEAKKLQASTGRETLLFIDEIHRFSKSQQDALLPGVENRDVTFVAATTENPSYAVIRPLLSRSVIVRLKPLDSLSLERMIDRAISSPSGLNGGIHLDDKAKGLLIEAGAGDGRKTLGLLEVVFNALSGQSSTGGPINDGLPVGVDQVAGILESVSGISYDRNGDDHYDMVSAFIKSMRGSDAQAAVYWAARMLDAGEDPMFIARRVVIAAAEEVGLANPQALVVAQAAMQAVSMIGMPEARIPLSEAILMVATSPKSNASYKAINSAIDAVRGGSRDPVPLHLRNAVDREKEDAGYGRDYKYAHDWPYGIADQQYLPDGMEGTVFYEPKHVGEEKNVQKRMAFIESRLHPQGDGEE